MKEICFAVLLFMFSGSRHIFAQPADVLTLESVINLAVRNNPALLSAEQNIIIAKQRVSEARFLFLPQFALSGTLSKVNLQYPMALGPELGDRYLGTDIKENFYTMRAYALQPLYNGGRNKNTLRMAKTAHKQAKVNYDTVKMDVILKAKRAFYTLLYHRNLAAIAKKWHEDAAALNSGIKKDGWESIEAKMLISRLEKQTKASGKNMEAARTELIKVLNREPNYRFDIDGSLGPAAVRTDMQKSLVTAMEARSELKSEIYKAQLDALAVNMAMIRRSPNIYLGGSYDVIGYKGSSLDNSVRSSNWMASIAIHFPLTYNIWTQIVQKKAEQRQGDLKRVEVQDKIRFEIINAYKELEFRQAESAGRKDELAAIKLDYEEAFKHGPAALSTLRAFAAICELEKGYFESVYSLMLARIRLEWAQGKDLNN
ncbi:MAG: TolC family protein [Elusimicrobia bacterium]|nr:TolC family protein [Elusimicrobiota bacterium]